MEAVVKKCSDCGETYRITPIELRFMAANEIKPGDRCRSCVLKGERREPTMMNQAKSARTQRE